MSEEHHNGCWTDKEHHDCATGLLRELYTATANILIVLQLSNLTVSAGQAQLLASAVAELLSVQTKIEFEGMEKRQPADAEIA